MGDHKFTKDAGAALVFLVLYGILFVWMISGYITKRYKWRSRWSLLFFHVTVRVASQVGRKESLLACRLAYWDHVPALGDMR